MSTTTNLSKKAKTDSSSSSPLLQEFAQVRSYLLDCPLVNSEHPAIQSALKGLDQEVKRRERDAKLQSKFVTIDKPKTTVTAATTTMNTSNNNNPTNPNHAATETASLDEAMTDDWQAVSSQPEQGTGFAAGDDVASFSSPHETSFLGQRLAKTSIATIAEHGVRCATPLQALALILHAALRSKALGFKCTGIPQDATTAASSGFAAPIRELPPTQLLPQNWNQQPKQAKNKNGDGGDTDDDELIQLRYRKNGTGAVVLQVRLILTACSPPQQQQQQQQPQVVQVWLNRANTAEPPSQSLEFNLDQHINLDSWKRAAIEHGSGGTVAPALHYKGLAALLDRFCQTFDLGPVTDGDADDNEAAAAMDSAYVDTTVLNLPTRRQGGIIVQQVVRTGTTTAPDGTVPLQPPMRPMVVPPVGGGGNRNYHNAGTTTPTTIGDAFPGLRDARGGGTGGDFAGDLLPGGGGLPGAIPPHHPLGGGGNLMGPNHPAFWGGAAPPPGGLGMRPRYDPTGPPGGPQDPNHTDGDDMIPGMPPNRGGRHPGEPNPDHLRPPNNLNNNNNMFM